MAEVVVTYVLEKIGEAAYQEALILYGVEDKVVWAKSELEWISAFLQDADAKAKQNLDNRVKQWVKNVKEVTYMIEDALDKFLAEVGGCSQKLSVRKRILNLPKTLAARHRVGVEIDKIKERVCEIKESALHYGIEKLRNGSTSSEPVNKVVSIPMLPYIDETEVVGFETDMNQIVQQLTNKSNSKRSVISIVGTGGLGKTTLAKLVYKSDVVKNNFGYCMWLTISKEYDLLDILRKIHKQIHGSDHSDLKPLEIDDLVKNIYEFLVGKTYFVVLDDVWSTALWTEMQKVLPDVKNGSRALITTRTKDVAQEADCSIRPYELQALSKEKSLELMLQKAFPNHFANKCPEDLVDLANQLSNRCAGLPLALVVMGRILSKKHPDFTTWSELLRKTKWHTDGKECMEIVSTSFMELSLHLKSCFMYFSVFPEDYEIKANSLLRLWIAEGFIPQEEIMEDTAKSYLEELVQRCMVQVTKRSYRGTIKSCRVHDVLHELAIRKAQEENFLTVLSNSNNNPTSTSGSLARRIALHLGDTRPVELIGPNLRSFVCFGNHLPSCNEMKMARIVNFYGSTGHRTLVNYERLKGLKHLTTLRHFVIRNIRVEITKILPYLAHSNFFQTLEITDALGGGINEMHELPSSFWDNKMLRHVIWSDWDVLQVMGPPSAAHLGNLLTLKGVHARNEWSVQLPHFPRIRKLFLNIDPSFVWKAMTSLMSKLEHLGSLFLRADNQQPMKDPCITPAFKNFRHMYKLRLICVWPKNAVIDSSIFPPHLVKLSLAWSRIKQDPMPEFEKLPCLRILFLGENSYMGEQVICSAGGFKCLQQLTICDLQILKSIKIEKGAMPILNQLELKWIFQMDIVPDLQHLITLCEFNFWGMSDQFCTRLKGVDRHKVQHIASVSEKNILGR